MSKWDGVPHWRLSHYALFPLPNDPIVHSIDTAPASAPAWTSTAGHRVPLMIYQSAPFRTFPNPAGPHHALVGSYTRHTVAPYHITILW